MKKNKRYTSVLALAVGLSFPAVAMAPSASAVDVGDLFSSTLTTQVVDHAQGESITSGKPITLTLPQVSIPAAVTTGDTITITLPDYLTVDPNSNVQIQHAKGGIIGMMKATGLHQYTLTFNSSLQEDDGTLSLMATKFIVFPVIGGSEWSLGTSKTIGYSINGKSITSPTSLVAASSSFVNSATLAQREGSETRLEYTQSILTKSISGVPEFAPIAGPHHVTMKAGSGLRFNCDEMSLSGVPTRSYNFSKVYPGSVDTSTAVDATPRVKYSTCTDDNLVFDSPAITSEDGVEYDYVQFHPTLEITPSAYNAAQVDFSVYSTVQGKNSSGGNLTSSFSAKSKYAYFPGSPNGAARVSIQSYLNDSSPTAPTGTTANGQNSDADDYPGEDILEGSYKTTIVLENRGYKDLTNLSVTNLNGDVVKTLPSLKMGEKVTLTVDSNLTGSSDGSYYGDSYSVSADSTNGTLWATDGVNATVYKKVSATVGLEASINGQDADSAITLPAGIYPVSYRVDNPNSFPITISSLTGIDGKAVSLGSPITLAAGASTIISGSQVTLGAGQKVGGSAKVTATYDATLPVVLGGSSATVSAEDGAYASSVAVKAPTVVDDSSSTAYNTAVTVDVLSNDKADTGLKLNSSTLTILDSSGKKVNTLTVANGTFSISSGKVTFTPKSGVSGSSSARYLVADELGNESQGTINVNVLPAPPAPTTATATNDTVTLEYGKSTIYDVLANDSATKGWNLSTLKLLPATGGSASDSLTVSGGKLAVSSGKISITPNDGFSGAMGSARYQITSNDGKVATASISVNVKAAPVVNQAFPDSGSATLNRAVTMNVLSNDKSEKGIDATSLRIVNPVTKAQVYQLTTTGGTYYMRQGGVIYFLPKAGFAGKAGAVTYTVKTTDGRVLTSTAEATITK